MNENGRSAFGSLTTEEKSVSLGDYLNVLRRGWRLIALCACGVGFFSLIWSLFTTSIYVATATLQIGEARPGALFGDLEALQSRADPLYSEMEILKSRTIAEDVVRQLQLQLKLKDVPAEMGLEISDFVADDTPGGTYTLRFADSRGSFVIEDANKEEVARGKVGEPVSFAGATFTLAAARASADDEFRFSLSRFYKSVRRLQRATKVTAKRSTNVVQVSMEATSPREASDMANAVASAYINSTVKRRAQHAFTTKDFIGKQLENVERDLLTAEQALTRYKSDKGIVTLPQEADRLLEHWTFEETKLVDLQTNIQEAEAILEALRNPSDPGRPLAVSTAGMGNPTLAELASRLTTLELEQAEYNEGLAVDHPAMQGLRAQIDEARRKLQDEVAATLENLREREAALATSLERYEADVRRLPEAELGLVGLIRRSKVNQDLYTLLLQKYEEARIAEAAEVGTAHLVDPALPPSGPSRPTTTRNVLLGLFLGLLFGVGQVFLLEHMDDSMRSVRDLEQHVGLPTFGLIPDFPERVDQEPVVGVRDREARKRSARLIHGMEPGTLAVESYRCLRTNIRFATPDTKVPCYLVTSAGPGEGKSLTSSNMGIALAEMGQRVVLVDADLRRPMIHRLFGLSRDRGLSDILAGNALWQECVQSTPVKSLKILPAGQLPPNPAELLASERVPALLKDLSNHFDVVLVDSPPAIPLTDASIVGAAVDGVFLVVRAGMTSAEAARRAKITLENVGSRLLGVIFNGASLQEGLGLPGHYRYYYSGYYRQSPNDADGSSRSGLASLLVKGGKALRTWRKGWRGVRDELTSQRWRAATEAPPEPPAKESGKEAAEVEEPAKERVDESEKEPVEQG